MPRRSCIQTVAYSAGTAEVWAQLQAVDSLAADIPQAAGTQAAGTQAVDTGAAGNSHFSVH